MAEAEAVRARTYRVPKEGRPIWRHPITAVGRQLCQRIYGYLDSIKVKWMLVDPVRVAEVGNRAGPLSLWIGVMTDSLSHDDPIAAAVANTPSPSFIGPMSRSPSEVFTRSAGRSSSTWTMTFHIDIPPPAYASHLLQQSVAISFLKPLRTGG